MRARGIRGKDGGRAPSSEARPSGGHFLGGGA
jgi:hypothetical protein